MITPILVGIDYGTTNTKASIREEYICNQPKCIEFVSGKNYLSSEIAINKKDKSCIVGLEDGESTYYKIAESKRLIGRAYKSVMNKEDFSTRLGYHVANVDGMANIRINSTTDGSNDVEIIDIDPRLVTADILKKVKKHIIDTNNYPDDTIVQAVVTVPANYGYSQKSATMEAAELSGLQVLLLIPEPTAAALAFLDSKKFSDGYYLVIDFGGGTLDLSLVHLEGKKVIVKKVFGNMFLGGGDVDQAIAEVLKTKIDPALEIPVQIENIFSKTTEIVNFNNAILKKKSKTLKEMLSEGTNEEISLSINLKGYSGMKIVNLSFSKQELCAVLNSKFREPFEKVLKECKNGMECELDGILLAGGSSKLPTIESWTRNVFEQVTIHTHAHDVQTLVARGAFLAAESIRNGTNQLENLQVMEEVTATHLGIETKNVVTDKVEFTTLIPMHSPLKTSFTKTFTNVVDDQEKAKIRVLENLSESFEDSTEISSLVINIMKRKKGETKIDVTFSVDLNGILQVAIVEQGRDSDNKHEIKTTLTNLWTPEQIEEFRKRKHFSVQEVTKVAAQQVPSLSQNLSSQIQFDLLDELFKGPNKQVLILDTGANKPLL
ncbi:predicted protein [Naegleria gruberi]|uniref:Predicted protein n=1 Tax=Naegleria gruberi TaxID=5762 RepID=D2VYW5_NAEGR|nr:uncharacterized protein NAEGRDRAFT_81760 [Naegleria gruberi]EFC37983.1 predicted protein [Naegleria gruberi]|eukprot:XP_002670727.1 predicted protein [Naegleria gruberi strain NEG-M]